ncbi:MAG: hypothetical protein JWP08_1996 [Bryobacterales bacterium]|nr:hypothetical protein [Bryobacterales bacterium]
MLAGVIVAGDPVTARFNRSCGSHPDGEAHSEEGTQLSLRAW